jgi:transcriptional regulator with XRE-family HTH domain
MTNRMKSGATLVTCGAALAFGAWALGNGVGDDQSSAATRNAAATAPPGAPYGRPWGHGFRRHGFGPGPAADLEAAAQKLGVTPAKLRAALKSVMQEQRAAHQKAEAAALAKALGLPEGKVAAALAKVRPDKGERRERRLERAPFVRGLAAALHKSPAEVRRALRSAQSSNGDRFAALAKALGVSEAQLRSAMMQAAPKPGLRRGEHRADLSALAKELGVSQAELRAALMKTRGAMRPDPGDFAAALAGKLGVSEAKVRSALPAPRFEFHHRFRGTPPHGGMPGPAAPPPAP